MVVKRCEVVGDFEGGAGEGVELLERSREGAIFVDEAELRAIGAGRGDRLKDGSRNNIALIDANAVRVVERVGDEVVLGVVRLLRELFFGEIGDCRIAVLYSVDRCIELELVADRERGPNGAARLRNAVDGRLADHPLRAPALLGGLVEDAKNRDEFVRFGGVNAAAIVTDNCRGGLQRAGDGGA